MSGLPELVRVIVGVAVVSVLDPGSPVDGPLKNVVGIVVSEISAVVEQRLSIGDGVVVARRGARRLDSEGSGAKTVRGEVVVEALDCARRGPAALVLVHGGDIASGV